MWLKHHDQTRIRPHRPGRPQSLTNLLGVMSVVINHRHATALADHLKAPVDTTKGVKRLGDRWQWHIQFAGHDNRGQGVVNVVHARQIEGEAPEVPALMIDLKPGAGTDKFDIPHHIIGLARHAVRQVAFLNARHQTLDMGLIDANDATPIKWHLIDKLDKRILNRR